jgi:hypothetical protein
MIINSLHNNDQMTVPNNLDSHDLYTMMVGVIMVVISCSVSVALAIMSVSSLGGCMNTN